MGLIRIKQMFIDIKLPYMYKLLKQRIEMFRVQWFQLNKLRSVPGHNTMKFWVPYIIHTLY